MTSAEIEELVFDTLYFNRTDPDRHCLQVNLAGQELEKQRSEALPRIEYVLSTVVVPAPPPVRKKVVFANGDERWYEEDPFPGLSGLLGAYLLIGSRHDVVRVVGFLRSLPPALLAKVVALVPVFFRKAKFRPQEKEVNDLKEPPNERLVSFIEEASQSDHQALRENALWAMAFYLP